MTESLPKYKNDYITEQEYLVDEKDAEIRHEYVDGEIFAVAGTKKNHQRLIMTLASAWYSHLKGTPCEVFSSDIKVRVADGKKYFYPGIKQLCVRRLVVSIFPRDTPKFLSHLTLCF
jgi:Uma2 family endonuclease